MRNLIAAAGLMLVSGAAFAHPAPDDKCTDKWDAYENAIQSYTEAKTDALAVWTAVGDTAVYLSGKESVGAQEFEQFTHEVIAFSGVETEAGDAVVDMINRVTDLLACLIGTTQ